MQEQKEMNKSFRLLEGHVALITGGSRGIGAATARLFARHGAAVGVNYHASAARAQEVVEAIRAEGGRAIALEASAGNVEQVAGMVQHVERELGPIDTLVLNAMASGSDKPDAPTDEAAEARRASIFAPFLASDWRATSGWCSARWPASISRHTSWLH